MATVVKNSWDDPAIKEKASLNNKLSWTEEKRERQARRLFGSTKRKIESGQRTKGEASIEKALIELGITYLFEHNIGRYWVDFALPEHRIIIECDGTWHLMTKERDAKRDAYLASLGWRIVHFPREAAIKDSVSLLKTLL